MEEPQEANEPRSVLEKLRIFFDSPSGRPRSAWYRGRRYYPRPMTKKRAWGYVVVGVVSAAGSLAAVVYAAYVAAGDHTYSEVCDILIFALFPFLLGVVFAVGGARIIITKQWDEEGSRAEGRVPPNKRMQLTRLRRDERWDDWQEHGSP